MITNKPIASAPPRLQRMLIQLHGYNFTMTHRPGSQNQLADGLSRLPSPDNVTTIDLDLRLDQRELKLPADQVGALQIEQAHRTGAPTTTQRERTIVVKFASFKDRDTIIRAARMVKPKGFFFNEDFSQRVISRRKELLPDMRQARERGKIAYLSFDKLVVKDRQPHLTQHLPQPVIKL